LVVTEEKEFVLDDWTTDRAAELLPASAWNESARDGIWRKLSKGIARLIRVGATEPEAAAVDIVAARLRLSCHDSGDGLAKFRVIVLERHLRFGHRIQVWIYDDDPKNWS